MGFEFVLLSVVCGVGWCRGNVNVETGSVSPWEWSLANEMHGGMTRFYSVVVIQCAETRVVTLPETVNHRFGYSIIKRPYR